MSGRIARLQLLDYPIERIIPGEPGGHTSPSAKANLGDISGDMSYNPPPSAPSLVLYNIHNFGISGELFLRVRNSLISDCKLVQNYPQSVRFLLGGDLNFDALGNLSATSISRKFTPRTVLHLLQQFLLGCCNLFLAFLPYSFSAIPTWAAMFG